MNLSPELLAEISAFPCQTSILVADVDTDEVLFELKSNVQTESASTIKVPLLMTALDLVQKGCLSLEQMLPIPKSSVLPDTQVFERDVESYSLWEVLYWMIVQSDNTATNAIITLLGFDAVNHYISSTLSLTGTQCKRKMLDWDAIKAGHINFTCAQDQFHMYRSLCNKTVLTPELCDVALDMLLRQRASNVMLRYIPEPVVLANKPGNVDGVVHDAGVFFFENRKVFVGIFTWDGPAVDKDKLQRMFAGRLAKLIYDSLKGV